MSLLLYLCPCATMLDNVCKAQQVSEIAAFSIHLQCLDVLPFKETSGSTKPQGNRITCISRYGYKYYFFHLVNADYRMGQHLSVTIPKSNLTLKSLSSGSSIISTLSSYMLICPVAIFFLDLILIFHSTSHFHCLMRI